MEVDGVLPGIEAVTIMSEDALETDFNRLLAANGPALTRLAASYTNTIGDRDDLLQETALAIWQGLRHFRGECSERTFLFRIAHNRAVDYVVRNRTRPAASDGVEVLDPSPSSESDVSRAQQADRLRSAIQRLPVGYRQVVTLTLEDLTYVEIAEVLGISESNVGARLTRARQMLREFLEERR